MSNKQISNALYLYCIIPKSDPHIGLELTGLADEKIFTVAHRDLLAIVSNSPYKVYDLSPENLLTHEGVIREVMNKCDVLPFNFGNVMKSRKDLIKFIDSVYSHIWKMFGKISGKIELGLKVFIKKEKFNDEIETGEIKKLKKQFQALEDKKAILLKADIGKLVQNSVENKRNECEEKIFDFLKQYCSDSKLNNCSTVTMILNAAFLVNKDKIDHFDEKVSEIESKYEDNLEFRYTGPWPAFNFINMPG